MLATMMDVPLTLNHVLERAGRLFPRVEIVSRQPDKTLHRTNYAAMRRRALQLAQALHQAGLRRGDRVATLMWNHYAHLEAYFGVPAAGGVLHTLNLRLTAEDIGYIAHHAGDRFLIVDDVLLPLLEKFRKQTQIERVFVFPFSGRAVPAEYENYETFLAGAHGEFIYPNLDEREPCAMCYTSGTTGRPKGVVYSHRSTVLHTMVQCMGEHAVSNHDVVVPVVPMFHANAWGYPYACTMVGAKQVFPGDHLDSDSLLDLFQSEQATVAAGVPTIWLAILQNLEQHPGRWKLKPMRMLVGGSAVPESLIRSFERYGLHILQGWGMTETSPLATISVPKASQLGLGADAQIALRAKQGWPVPFVELRGMGDAGEIPWDGETVGEIEVRGPWVTGSYYNVATDSEKFTDDGWLRTGDVASIDAEGCVRITDRTKDLIKSGGEWISSVDLENAIMGHPEVLEAAVIAVPHPKWGERPLAVVVRKAGTSVQGSDIKAFLSGDFARWMIPEGYAFISEIPRTSTGKFQKSKLRAQFKDWVR